MSSLEKRIPVCCPHFLSDIKSCSLSPGGIYVPLRIHVINYCMSDNYKKCKTYKECCIDESNCYQQAYQSDKNSDGRRRFERINKRYKVLLRSSDSIGITKGDFIESAMTMDFSQGGMRVVVNNEIPQDSFVVFNFDDDFLVPGLQGLAQFCWHRRFDENPKMIESGLAFKDGFSQAVLALELDK